jgi:hypothetical protein
MAMAQISKANPAIDQCSWMKKRKRNHKAHQNPYDWGNTEE